MRRMVYTATYTCKADESLFSLPWEKLPASWQEIIDAQNGLPCDGGGVPGEWCERGLGGNRCYWFGGREDEDAEEADTCDD